MSCCVTNLAEECDGRLNGGIDRIADDTSISKGEIDEIDEESIPGIEHGRV